MMGTISKRLSPTRGLWALWIALVALVIAPAALAAPGVKDDASFFKPETVEKVNAEIQQIHKDFGKELVVETYPTVPEKMKADWESAKDNAQSRSAFFSKWLGERAHDLQVNGVYVLIVKDPGHLEVKAGVKTKAKAFTEANQNKMRDILLEDFKAEKYDDGLQKAVEYLRDSLKENLGGVVHTGTSASAQEQFHHSANSYSSGSSFPTPNRNVPKAAPSSGRSFMWIILVVVAAFIIIRILSNLGSGPRNYGGGGGGAGYGSPGPGYGQGYGGPAYGGGGGGGFFRNMLGGMLGGAAGGYLYDRFRDRNEGPTHYQGGPPPADTSSSGDFGGSSASDDNDRGQGFGGGGSSGDFGGSSDAGGGFGSSDSGSSGGDFGGSSDSGSSGGDSGGSGGDF